MNLRFRVLGPFPMLLALLRIIIPKEPELYVRLSNLFERRESSTETVFGELGLNRFRRAPCTVPFT